MRDRSWRRYIEDVIVIRRLKRLKYTKWSFRMFKDVNGFELSNPMPFDWIGLSDTFIYKNMTTKFRDKHKYSPNKKSNKYWRDITNNTREYQKKEFLSILKEYGIK